MNTLYKFKQPEETVEDRHYLKVEFDELLATDDSIFDFIEKNSLDGLWYWDLVHPENEYMSERFWRVLGYDPASKKHLVEEWQGIINPDDLAAAVENFEKHCADPNYPYDQLVRYRHANGSTVWIRCRGVAIRDSHGTPIRMLGTHNDVTAVMSLRDKNQEIESIKAVNRKLQQAARLDGFTDTLNRQGLILDFPGTVALAAEFEQDLSFAIIDIDNFKSVNDTHGHVAGDKMLMYVAKTAKALALEKDVVARLGGDEFAIVMPETNESQAKKAAKRICKAIAAEATAELGFEATVSIGFTTLKPDLKGLSSHGYPLEKWLEAADRGLYAAKRKGRNCVVPYHSSNW